MNEVCTRISIPKKKGKEILFVFSSCNNFKKKLKKKKLD